MSISNILFVGANDIDVEFPDYSIVLGSQHSNMLYIPDFKIAVNETKTIGLVLDNETSFTAFQTDVYLPEGLSIVANAFAVTNRASGHSVSAKSFSDGRTRITCFNPNNVKFSGNTGALVEFYITANKDVAESCSIELKNNIFSTATGSEFVLDNTTTNVTTERALVQSITLDSSTLSLIVGDTWQLNADVQPTFASTKELEWTSSNPDIATVSSNGFITATGIGTATITAAAVDGSGVKAECNVTVKNDSSGIETVTLDNLEIKIINNKLSIEGISTETTVRLYDINGRLIAVAKSCGDRITFDLSPNSIYILSIGKYSLKVTSK